MVLLFQKISGKESKEDGRSTQSIKKANLLMKKTPSEPDSNWPVSCDCTGRWRRSHWKGVMMIEGKFEFITVYQQQARHTISLKKCLGTEAIVMHYKNYQ